jgi:hypothetical protein
MTASDELRALVQRYARAVDDRDFDVLERCFHPDATIEGVRGVKPLAEWLETMRAPRRYEATMHFLGDPLIDLDALKMDTYAVVYQMADPASGRADLTLGIRYDDAVVHHGGRWVFRQRVARVVWSR